MPSYSTQVVEPVKGSQEALQVSFPGANLEVKIVLPISLRIRFVRILLSKSLSGPQNNDEYAQ